MDKYYYYVYITSEKEHKDVMKASEKSCFPLNECFERLTEKYKDDDVIIAFWAEITSEEYENFQKTGDVF